MSKTIKDENPIVQMYDFYKDREYIRTYGGAILRIDKVVRTERLENELILDIKSERIPDKIFFNGEEVKLVVNL